MHDNIIIMQLHVSIIDYRLYTNNGKWCSNRYLNMCKRATTLLLYYMTRSGVYLFVLDTYSDYFHTSRLVENYM